MISLYVEMGHIEGSTILDGGNLGQGGEYYMKDLMHR